MPIIPANPLQGSSGHFTRLQTALKAQFQSGELWPLEGDVDASAFEKVSDRLLGAVFYVATSLLEEGVTDMTDIDLGAKVGLRWKEGPFEVMNRVGIEKAYAQVKEVLTALASAERAGSPGESKQKGSTLGYPLCQIHSRW